MSIRPAAELTRAVMEEMFHNPGDLKLLISPDRTGNFWAVVINRGPKGQFKMLFLCPPFFESKAQAVTFVRTTLTSIIKMFRSDTRNGHTLSYDDVGKIVSDIQANDIAITYRMKKRR